ncbi:MAG: PilZ domain-containing protein [Bdellovibrionales bacterium]|nr:PilZ domain-containing protein [Bdellovibrionales bacterium]
MDKSEKTGIDRRGSRRRPILESFSFFVVVPKKGFHRLRVVDLSDTGVGFDYDIIGEMKEAFPVKAGEVFELQFYLNQTLFFPMHVKVARIDDSKVIRRIGAEFTATGTPEHQGLIAVLDMIDKVSEIVQFDSTPG